MARWFAVGAAATPGETMTEAVVSVVQIDIDAKAKGMPVTNRSVVGIFLLPDSPVEAAQKIGQLFSTLERKTITHHNPIFVVHTGSLLSRKVYHFRYVSTVDVADGPKVHPNRETIPPDEIVSAVFDDRVRLADGLDRDLVKAMLEGTECHPLAPSTIAVGLAIRASLEGRA